MILLAITIIVFTELTTIHMIHYPMSLTVSTVGSAIIIVVIMIIAIFVAKALVSYDTH